MKYCFKIEKYNLLSFQNGQRPHMIQLYSLFRSLLFLVLFIITTLHDRVSLLYFLFLLFVFVCVSLFSLYICFLWLVLLGSSRFEHPWCFSMAYYTLSPFQPTVRVQEECFHFMAHFHFGFLFGYFLGLTWIIASPLKLSSLWLSNVLQIYRSVTFNQILLISEKMPQLEWW